MEDSTASKLKQIIETLGEIALQDEKISDDEFAILKQVSFDLIQYDKAMKKALEDGIITEDEQMQLNQLKNDVEKNVISVAVADKNVSDDETKLVKTLVQLMKQYFS